MIKKYYTFLIASGSNQINRSFRLSKFALAIAIIFFLMICFFAGYGFLTIINPGLEIKKYNHLKSFKSDVYDLVFAQLDASSDSVVLNQIRNLIIYDGPLISMIAPVDGYVTQGIDSLNNHNGIDIISKRGDYIKVAEDGIVLFSGYKGELGNTLLISHPYNYFTIYGHCDSLFVNEKERVRKGDVIAILGNSGETTAPHLHFEIWKDNIVIDPRTIIKKYGDLDVSKE